ncbi:MAG: hypothetical protein EU529_08570 [Promethearchaeota archaeon]|nr:MAG: hypothetical protein EU529_08570 [Candidatus Lokiarchaeota archaeon]
MILEKLNEWPSPKITKHLLIFSIILTIIVYPIMAYFFILSKYPVGFIESQLSFSGSVLKGHYKITNINYYRIMQILDYAYMISYGTFSFSLALIISRKFENGSFWSNSGHLISILGIFAACCDAIENAFILAMLTDPSGFPDIWAITHSCFALVKYILLFTCIGWAIVAAITLLIKKRSS